MIDNQIVRKLDESLIYLEKEKRVNDVARLTVLRDGRLHLERIKNQSELYYIRGIIDDSICLS
jgi:hypothetical protein